MRQSSRLRLGETTIQECGGYRQTSRSVSWNSTGSLLASASSDRLAKIWSLDQGSSQGREVCAVTGHNAGVERVRFHPEESTLLCTSAEDASIRLWDIRINNNNQRCLSRIDVLSSPKYNGPAAVEWHPSSRTLVVSEKDASIYIYDMRKLNNNNSSSSSSSSGSRATIVKPVRTFDLNPHSILLETHFSPSGSHLVAATKSTEDGMGQLRVFPWKNNNNNSMMESPHSVFVGHTGSIYSLQFSPDGTRLATGGYDAVVGLWDVRSMVCTSTVSTRTKFIRSVSFTHDSNFVANCTEEDGIQIATADTGTIVGTVNIHSSQQNNNNNNNNKNNSNNSRFYSKAGGGGADEIAFHPNAFVLACARGNNNSSSSGFNNNNNGGTLNNNTRQVTVANIKFVN